MPASERRTTRPLSHESIGRANEVRVRSYNRRIEGKTLESHVSHRQGEYDYTRIRESDRRAAVYRRSDMYADIIRYVRRYRAAVNLREVYIIEVYIREVYSIAECLKTTSTGTVSVKRVTTTQSVSDESYADRRTSRRRTGQASTTQRRTRDTQGITARPRRFGA